jgi:hypothetical protein
VEVGCILVRPLDGSGKNLHGRVDFR